jgi:hypothetical protein
MTNTRTADSAQTVVIGAAPQWRKVVEIWDHYELIGAGNREATIWKGPDDWQWNALLMASSQEHAAVLDWHDGGENSFEEAVKAVERFFANEANAKQAIRDHMTGSESEDV